MLNRHIKKYVVLQEYVPPREQRAIKRAVVTVWPFVRPSRAFVRQLSLDLVAEARRAYELRNARGNRTLNFLGLFSGGVLSVAGGLAIWLLVQRERGDAGTAVRARRQAAPTAI